MTKEEKIKKFIEDNDCIDLDAFYTVHVDSELDGMIVILAGFACYLEITDAEELANIIDPGAKLITDEAFNELKRVLIYADHADYKSFWETKEAKEQYIF